ncbi:4'-phosphopantetheinyl transferase family protein [Spirosoma validum]|uniref:4'-phosphopantetheinyl transferase superfamily protein n=1 Tax=Spirosoma validum TaxID=2771355 RepID=A0A927B2I5_9BACT|nr:4'-phosphopantetheinyl transferase superfamily protein [Spirosoma validum]MBD2754067.1 4'-phosphopantetheinyl transferase superfamily protein [Spirosoma validum]
MTTSCVIYWTRLSGSSVDACLQAGAHDLPPNLWQRSQHYRDRQVRALSVLGKRLLEYGLSRYMPSPHGQLLKFLRYTAQGSPYLSGLGLSVSFSHSADVVACALSEDGPVGVDVQSVQRFPMQTDGRLFLNAAELGQFTEKTYVDLWAKKEAVYKVTASNGNGSQTPFKSLTVTTDGNVKDAKGQTYHTQPFHVGPGYVSYVAANGPVCAELRSVEARTLWTA